MVRAAAGRVRGSREAGLTVWRGVPFAAPPVGPLPLVQWGMNQKIMVPAFLRMLGVPVELRVEPSGWVSEKASFWKAGYSNAADVGVLQRGRAPCPGAGDCIASAVER